METVPKIVQQRLRAADGNFGDHPGPDLLTAFAERTLLKREQAQVLEHLARCQDCRDVVSLAMPEFAAGQAIAVRKSWLRWPALRWAAAAACVVVVGAAVSLRYGNKAEYQGAAQEKRVLQQPATPVLAPAPAEDKLAARAEMQTAPPASQPAGEKLAKKFDQGAVAAGRTASRDVSNQPATAGAAALAGIAAPAPEQRKEAEIGVPAPPSATNEMMLADTKSNVSAMPGKAKDEVSPLAKARQGVAAGTMAYSAKPSLKVQGMLRADLGPRWAVSPMGVLERSLDGGSTWQAVPVAQSVVFRVVTSVGAHVWAGGVAGALYHSPDAGRHWVQVKPAVAGQTLSADIVSIEFSDPQNGKLGTSENEIWITADAGQSWQKQ